MKRFITLAAAVMTLFSASAKIEKSNERTAEHKKFDNYSYAIVPPAGYELTDNGTAFRNAEKKSGISISHLNMILDASSENELLKATFQNFIAGYQTNESVYINDAEHYLVSKTENNRVFTTLVVPEDNGSVMLTASSPADDLAEIEKTKEALLSVVFIDPADMADNPIFENSLYSIANQGFRAQPEGSTLVAFCESGDFAKELATGRNVYFKVLMNEDAVKAKEQKMFATEVVKALVSDNETITSDNAVTVNGLPGFEYFITEMENGTVKSKSYAMVVFTTGKYYCFTSKANQEFDMYLQKFQAAAKSFQAKK
ncbi:MAG: hypothetical protein MJY63_03370 [Paludibacteraceae bacterium]|nr:hypothetical protein [Paludibacteraceae bacterium]